MAFVVATPVQAVRTPPLRLATDRPWTGGPVRGRLATAAGRRPAWCHEGGALLLPWGVRRMVPTVEPSRCQHTSESEPPDYSAGWVPEKDDNYDEVNVYSLGPASNNDLTTLLTLAPVADAQVALKMSVTCGQASSIKDALRNKKLSSAALAAMRPSTHDLLLAFLEAQSAFITKAAVTHVSSAVYHARVWFRTSGGGDGSGVELNVDARPSDAIVLATRCKAPLFINKTLLATRGLPLSQAKSEVTRGLTERVVYATAVMSTRSVVAAVRRQPEHLQLAKLKMELDLAVRLERFGEAARLRDALSKLCPIELLQVELNEAVAEERFADAVDLRDKIQLWRLRMLHWEQHCDDDDGEPGMRGDLSAGDGGALGGDWGANSDDGGGNSGGGREKRQRNQ